MNHKGMIVGIDKKSKNTLFLPSSMKREGLLSAAFGTKVVKCRVAFSQSLEKSALLSEDLFEELLIPHKSRADFLIHGQTVHIGLADRRFHSRVHIIADPPVKRPHRLLFQDALSS